MTEQGKAPAADSPEVERWRKITRMVADERDRAHTALKMLQAHGCWSSAADSECPICIAAEAVLSFARTLRSAATAAEPPLKAVEIPAIPDSKG